MFYGWKIVGVSFATHFISVGFIFYSYGVFFKALAAEFGGSRLEVSLGLMLINVVNAAFAPFLGKFLDHHSVRNIMCLGVIAMAAGLFAASRVQSLLQFYVVLASLLGVGAAMMGQLPSSTLVSNWFVRRRGMALGVATMGISFSGVVMAPVTTVMVASLGWRQTFVAYGFIALAVGLPLVWLFVVKRPEDLGLYPDGSDGPALDEPGLPLATEGPAIDALGGLEWTYRGLLRDRNFWVISLTTSLCFASMSALLVHMVPHVTDLEFSPQKAAFALSACAGAGVAGKVLFGWIADLIDTRLAFWASILCQLCGMAVIQTVDAYPAILMTSAVFGLGMGGIVPLSGSLVGQVFGRRSFGRTMGLMSPVMLPFQFLGPPFAGYIYDRTGSYFFAFKIYIGFYILAACALLLLRLPGPNREVSNAPAR